MDPRRPRAGQGRAPSACAIAHGYLTLSLAPVLLNKVLRVDNTKFGVNYGCNKVRFPSPLPVGSELRMGVTIAGVEDTEGGVQVTYDIVMEVRTPQACVRGASGLPLLPLSVTRRPDAGTAADPPTGRGEDSARVRAMFDTIAPRYDLVNRLMTFGLDQSWRRGTVAALALPEGSLVLDLACGTGDLSRLAQRSGYRVIGADLERGHAGGQRHRRPPGARPTAAGSPSPTAPSTACVCGYALRNFTDLAGDPGECARVLRPGGRLAVLEVDAPTVPDSGAPATTSGSTRPSPPSAARSRTRRPTTTSPGRSPTCRPRRCSAACCSRPGSPLSGIRPLAGGLSQLVVATRSRRHREPTATPPLHARTVPLDYGPDALQFDGSPTVLFDRPGLTLVGWGTAALVPADRSGGGTGGHPVRRRGAAARFGGRWRSARSLSTTPSAGYLVVPRFTMGIVTRRRRHHPPLGHRRRAGRPGSPRDRRALRRRHLAVRHDARDR